MLPPTCGSEQLKHLPLHAGLGLKKDEELQALVHDAVCAYNPYDRRCQEARGRLLSGLTRRSI